MGIIRVLLALSVVAAHFGGIWNLRFVGGQVAVQSFYIISGFYMSLILNEKYVGKNKSYKLFITNRFLRLYPIYWLSLIHISEPTRLGMISYAVFCLKKKKKKRI